jgi:probable addiction module antidote protein
MEVELKPWSTADYLRTELDLADYLEAVLEKDDGPTIYAVAIADAARARGGVKTLAEESGVPEAEIQDAITASEEDALPVVKKLEQAYKARSSSRKVA